MRVRQDRELRALVLELIESGAAAAAVAVVGRGRTLERAGWGGRRRKEGEADLRWSDLFDFASLTKPCTASLALRLDRRGLLALDTPIGAVWPRTHRDLADRTLEDLLRHRSGLLPWAPLYRLLRRPERAAGLLTRGRLLGARRGTYSDLGYLLWGLAAREVLGRPFDRLLEGELGPLGSTSGFGFSPGPEDVVECPLDNRREVELAAALGLRVGWRSAPSPGVVQDGNARFVGPAGHAGMFGSARALWALGVEWLRPGGLLEAEAVAAALEGPRPFLLGWKRQRAAAPALTTRAFGHVGFTGGGLWVDPVADLVLVLLTHRTAVDADLGPWRRRLHGLARG